MQAIAGVLLVLLLAALGGAALMRSGRLGPGRASFAQVLGAGRVDQGQVRVVSRQQVAPGSWLVLAESGQRRVLLVIGAQATAVDAWTETPK